MITARQAALEAINAVIDKKHSLATCFDTIRANVIPADQALYHSLVYGVLREYNALSILRDTFLTKPLKATNNIIGIILNLGIFQLLRLSLGDHGVINETVKLAAIKKHKQATGLVNAILRRVQRERLQCQSNLDLLRIKNIPIWLEKYYPAQKEKLSAINSSPPPITFRLRHGLAREFWLQQHASHFAVNPLHPQAITLKKSLPITTIPEFNSGEISVQDAAAQWAASLLAPSNGEKILDACAAPGGKTGHILEIAPQSKVLALDQDKHRLRKVEENLNRLQLNAHCVVADAAELDSWWNGKLFDGILLDAPCSGSGVLRRHPDIAFLRTDKDLQAFPHVQYRLLCTLWTTLKPTGRLLYTTCSLLPRENQLLIEQFLATHKNAHLQKISVPDSNDTRFGYLHLPSTEGDGFFYALIRKTT